MEKNKTKSLRDQLIAARKKSMNLFADIAHRLESVETINGVEWINDSKATDINSTYYSLELMDKPVVWIVGSSEDELDYSILDKLVKYKVKRIICFGAYETQLKYSFANLVDGYAHKNTLEEAMIMAKEWTEQGDVVLFSPAVSSFGLYEDFRVRGAHFKNLV